LKTLCDMADGCAVQLGFKGVCEGKGEQKTGEIFYDVAARVVASTHGSASKL